MTDETDPVANELMLAIGRINSCFAIIEADNRRLSAEVSRLTAVRDAAIPVWNSLFKSQSKDVHKYDRRALGDALESVSGSQEQEPWDSVVGPDEECTTCGGVGYPGKCPECKFTYPDTADSRQKHD